ncbi:VIT domain-containing protein [Montanilutibacter psychrotolerans]|uniref:VIT domain-containing protein n=1 Tax=Montanilutibacter psychrotolerans TaxID=1327343 RepID=UPI001CC1F6E8|nr:VIT domain-containing protein [Lysobacter psychrotolerans]
MRLQLLVAAALIAVLPWQPAPAQSQGNLIAPPLLVAAEAEVPIRVASLEVTSEVNGGLARTTVEMRFHNPNGRQLEGELQFPLQAGQTVSGFALDIDGRMRPAVPVSKAKGQQVFESIARRRVDPGLLEQTAGNQFKLRVYPIPAHGERRVRISIDQALQRDADRSGWRFELPLAFARGVGEFPLRVIARGDEAAPRVIDGFGDIAFARDGDGYLARLDGRRIARSGLALRFAAAPRPQVFVQTVDGQRYFHAEVPFEGAGAFSRPLPKVVGLLWDSSASARNRDIDAELAVLDRYFAAVGNARVRLQRLRDVTGPVEPFTVSGGNWSALRAALRSTQYDGASALTQWQPQTDVDEYLLVSDGLSNYGTGQAMPALAPRQRLYALDSNGANADVARLTAWAEARGGRRIVVSPGTVAAATNTLLKDESRLLAIEGLGTDGLVVASHFPESGVLRIAGRLNAASATLRLRVQDGGPTDQASPERVVEVPVTASAPDSALVATLWAGYSLRELAAEPELHRARIQRIGSEFGVVTAETSLIVLEELADYAQHDIVPPAEYRVEVARLQAQRGQERKESRQTRLDEVAAELAEKLTWWRTSWPKGQPKQTESDEPAPVAYAEAAAMTTAAPPPPTPSPASPSVTARAVAPQAGNTGVSLDRIEVTGSRISEADMANAESEGEDGGEAGEGIAIAIQPWQPDSPFARRLRDAAAADVYAIYLDERDSHADSPAFYLDVADILFERGQRELALRVLSNLAEMNLENRHLLRVLGYRLMQADQPGIALPMFQRVLRLSEEEPQSWRDLGLAQAAVGSHQAAIGNLYEVVAREWDDRFNGVGMIALGELNAIIANSPRPLDTSAIDPRLLRNLPVDLRVVLAWDSDNSDMDLWVTDPNGEKTYFSNPRSYQGGRLSNDFTGGYGPEEFLLRDAKPGTYKVEANFYGDRQQLVTGATSLQLHFITGFGTAKASERKVTLRLKEASETVVVGEFEVR